MEREKRSTRSVDVVPLLKVKGCKDKCNNYKGINLLNVPGKVYRRVLTERLMGVTEGKVSKEQEEFRKGKGCIDQIFAIKMMIDYLEKGEKLCAVCGAVVVNSSGQNISEEIRKLK